MFQVVREGSQLRILHDAKDVMRGIRLFATLDGQESLPLSLLSFEQAEQLTQDAKCVTYEASYADEAKRCVLTLQLTAQGQTLIGHLDAHLTSDSVIKRHSHFSAANAITVVVGEVPEIDGLMANYQHKDWWTRPTFDVDLRKLPDRTQTLLWESSDTYYHLFPVCDDVYRAELAGTKDGLCIRQYSADGGHTVCRTLSFVLGAGDDPFALVEATAALAVEHLQGRISLRKDKRYPEVFEYLGWCSWDAFYHQVNAQGIIDKASELKSAGIPVKWFMIDDGWLNVQDDRLHAFTADTAKFPQRLGPVARQLQSEFDIPFVGVWHTFFGYWGGIDPTSELATKLSPFLYRTDNGHTVPYPDAIKGFGFWNSWHQHLKSEGINFVKVDGQSGVRNFLEYSFPIGEAAKGSHTALEASVALNFDGAVINCMGMAAENIWHRPTTAVSRNSDDFVPNEAGSFKEHALQNVYNSVYHGAFYVGDWDMFWTVHPQSVNNALLRAISGGPVYFSDPLGQTDPEKIWPLVLKNGRILRCDQPALPTVDCLMKNPLVQDIPLKVWNIASGIGIVAAFHIADEDRRLKGTIGPADIPGLEGQTFALYDYFRQQVSFIGSDDCVQFELSDNEYALYFVVPMEHAHQPLGLIDKYMAPAAIDFVENATDRFVVELADGGTFAFIAKDKPSSARVAGREVPVHALDDEHHLYAIDCQGVAGRVFVEVRF